MIDAARSLLGERPPSAISGRLLAERAGVDYGLIHRHFGSKADLLEWGFDEVVAEVGRSGFGPDGLPIAMYVSAHQPMWRALVHVVLDRAGFDEYRHRAPGLLRCIDAVRAARPTFDGEQGAAIAGLAMALEVGIPLHRQVLAPPSDSTPTIP